ncbi:SHD1 domain-containing protein [Mariniblastus sp.]|nr:SHD1 domain-containing protein [Mariniblastus sp.]
MKKLPELAIKGTLVEARMIGVCKSLLFSLILVAICGASFSPAHAQESALKLDLAKTISLDGNMEHRDWARSAPVMEYSSGGKWLAVRWADKVFVLDGFTHKVVYTIDSPNYTAKMRFSKKETELVLSYSHDPDLSVWNLKTGKPLGKVTLERPVKALEFHPKSGAVIYGAPQMGPASHVGEQPCAIMMQGWPNGPSGSFPLSNGIVDFYAFCVQPDDGRYIAMSSGNAVYVIDSKRKKLLHEWKFSERWPGVNTEGASLVPALNLDFSPDGKYLYSDYQSGPSRLVEVESGETVAGFDKTYSPKYWAGKFSPDGRTIAVIGYKSKTFGTNKIAILDASNGKPLVQLTSGAVLKDNPQQVAFTPDGLHLAVVSEEVCAIQLFSIPDLSKLLPPVDKKQSKRKSKKEKKNKVADTDKQKNKPTPAVTNDKLRTWSDASGTFSVKARFVSQDQTSVTLKKSNGKSITVKKSVLSPEDQAFLVSMKE